MYLILCVKGRDQCVPLKKTDTVTTISINRKFFTFFLTNTIVILIVSEHAMSTKALLQHTRCRSQLNVSRAQHFRAIIQHLWATFAPQRPCAQCAITRAISIDHAALGTNTECTHIKGSFTLANYHQD